MIGQDWRLVGTGTKICQTSAKENIEKNLEKKLCPVLWITEHQLDLFLYKPYI